MAVQRVANRSRDERIAQLEWRVHTLESQLEGLAAPREIELRNLSKAAATQEILALYASGETLYMSEVAERLRLADRVVVEICNELRAEGELVLGNPS